MADQVTRSADVLIPQVLQDMVDAILPGLLLHRQFVATDDTLVGKPGDTVTIPVWEYVGMADDLTEGVGIQTRKLSYVDRDYRIKEAGLGITVGELADLVGAGRPMDQAARQLAMAIADKENFDTVRAPLYAQRRFNGATDVLGYEGVVDAIDLFDEEINTDKVMFVHPKQRTQLRKDPMFLSADKYGTGQNVMLTGEFGRIANTRVVVSRAQTLFNFFYVFDPAGTDVTNANIDEVRLSLPSARAADAERGIAADKVRRINTPVYLNPIIQLQKDSGDEDIAAVTLFTKRGTRVAIDPRPKFRENDLYANQYYTAALTNDAKVVVAAFGQGTPTA